MEDDKSAPSSQVAADALSAKRAAARDSTFLRADVLRDGEAPLQGLRVRNLSAGGLMVETDQALPRGEAVTVVLRNLGGVPSRVAWTAPGRIGLAFDREIDPRAVRKAAPASPGAAMALFKPGSTQSRRPGLKIG